MTTVQLAAGNAALGYHLRTMSAVDVSIPWADLPDNLTLHIFKNLDSAGGGVGWFQLEAERCERTGKGAAKWTSHCRAVCKRWKTLASDDSLWQPLCVRTYGCFGANSAMEVAPKEGLTTSRHEESAEVLSGMGLGRPLPSDGFRGVWLHIHQVEQDLGGVRISGQLFLRSAAIWTGVKSWCTAHGAMHVAHSLCPPAQPDDWTGFIDALGLHEHDEALLPLKALYAVHNGQMTELDEAMDNERHPEDHSGIFAGLLGGYSAYDHLVCTRLFPLARMVAWTKRLRDSPLLAGELRLQQIVIAASFDLKKIFVLHAESGEVSMLKHTRDGPRLLLAVPPVDEGSSATRLTDGLLRWLECFNQRLQRGVYQNQRLLPVRCGAVAATLLRMAVGRVVGLGLWPVPPVARTYGRAPIACRSNSVLLGNTAGRSWERRHLDLRANSSGIHEHRDQRCAGYGIVRVRSGGRGFHLLGTLPAAPCSISCPI